MGAWGVKPLENDGALDWLAEYHDDSDIERIFRKIQSYDRKLNDIPSFAGEEAIAACWLLIDLHKPKKRLFRKPLTITPKKVLIQSAINTLDLLITDRSELRELWDESGELSKWLASIDELTKSLQQLIE